MEAAPLESLVVGAAWEWRGQATVLIEQKELGREEAGFSSIVSARSTMPGNASVADIQKGSPSLVLSNGAQRYQAYLVTLVNETLPTLIFESGPPPREQEFWISEVSEPQPYSVSNANGGGVVTYLADRRLAVTHEPERVPGYARAFGTTD